MSLSVVCSVSLLEFFCYLCSCQRELLLKAVLLTSYPQHLIHFFEEKKKSVLYQVVFLIVGSKNCFNLLFIVCCFTYLYTCKGGQQFFSNTMYTLPFLGMIVMILFEFVLERNCWVNCLIWDSLWWDNHNEFLKRLLSNKVSCSTTRPSIPCFVFLCNLIFHLFTGWMWCYRVWTVKELCPFRYWRWPQWTGTRFVTSATCLIC